MIYVLMKIYRENDFEAEDWTEDSWPVGVFSSVKKAEERGKLLLERDYEFYKQKYGEANVQRNSSIVWFNQEKESTWYEVRPFILDSKED